MAGLLDSQIAIRKTAAADVVAVSEVLLEAAQWIAGKGLPLWGLEQCSPKFLSADVAAGLFVVAEYDGHAIGAMRFSWEDEQFWPDEPAGEAAFIHRLAVRRQYSGGQLSRNLLNWAVEETCRQGRQFLRLDCAADRPRLRAIYENFGFEYHSNRQVGRFLVARYQYRVGKPAMNLHHTVALREYDFQGPEAEPRAVWVQTPALGANPVGICLFLDGEYYMAYIRAAEILATLQAQRKFPPMLVAYLASQPYSLRRWKDSFCNEDFAKYLATELVPKLALDFGVMPGENALVGLSLTGLSACDAALRYPAVFRRVLAQSGSFWWNDCWLPDEVRRRPCSNVAFRLTVGIEETKENVTHTNEGLELLQVASQLASNRKMRDALIDRRHRVSYAEHPGQHDTVTFRSTLEESLIALLALPPAGSPIETPRLA